MMKKGKKLKWVRKEVIEKKIEDGMKEKRMSN
jgi:hypothetical protein